MHRSFVNLGVRLCVGLQLVNYFAIEMIDKVMMIPEKPIFALANDQLENPNSISPRLYQTAKNPMG
jgi:hypothetical protein